MQPGAQGRPAGRLLLHRLFERARRAAVEDPDRGGPRSCRRPDFVPMLNMRVAQLRVVVDIMRVPELSRIESAGDTLRVGAAVRQSELERRSDLPSRQPLLAAALPWIGHAQTRSRGTVCGSVAHADPSAELPLVLMALGGEVETRSKQQQRRIPAETFFTGMMTTDLRDDELIEAVRFPAARAGTGYAFREIARRHGDFAIVACAAMVRRRAIIVSSTRLSRKRRMRTC